MSAGPRLGARFYKCGRAADRISDVRAENEHNLRIPSHLISWCENSIGPTGELVRTARSPSLRVSVVNFSARPLVLVSTTAAQRQNGFSAIRSDSLFKFLDLKFKFVHLMLVFYRFHPM